MKKDICLQQFVRKRTKRGDFWLRIGIVLLCLTLLTVFCELVMLVPVLAFGGLCFMIVIVGVCFYLFLSVKHEFEYIYDYDKLSVYEIRGKRKRKRKITVYVREILEFGRFSTGHGEPIYRDIFYNVASGENSNDVYYATYRNQENQIVMFLFSPDERFLDAIGKKCKKADFGGLTMKNIHLQQFVKKKITKKDIACMALVVLGCIIAVAAVICMVAFAIGAQILGGILLVCIMLYGWFFFMGFIIEYEYTYNNGDFLIEKVKGNHKRKNVVSVNARNILEFGKYEKRFDESIMRDIFYDFSAEDETRDVYYATYRDEEYKVVMFLFNPDERFLDAISRVYRRQF